MVPRRLRGATVAPSASVASSRLRAGRSLQPYCGAPPARLAVKGFTKKAWGGQVRDEFSAVAKAGMTVDKWACLQLARIELTRPHCPSGRDLYMVPSP